MKRYIILLNEINFVFNNLIVFQNLLASIVLFLAMYMLFSIFRIPSSLSIVLAILYFIFSTYSWIRRRYVILIESKYPALNERLRTADDNKFLENPVAQELEDEIIAKVRDVHTSEFLDIKKSSLKIFSALLLGFLIVFIASMDFHIDLSWLRDQIPKFVYREGGSVIGDGPAGNVRSGGQGFAENIFGDEEVAELSSSLTAAIHVSGYELTIDDLQPPQARDFTPLFPTEVFGESAESFEENIPKDQQEVVKNYFNEITKDNKLT